MAGTEIVIPWPFVSGGVAASPRVVDVGRFGDYSPFATVLYGRFIGGQGGIPWMNWIICRRPE